MVGVPRVLNSVTCQICAAYIFSSIVYPRPVQWAHALSVRLNHFKCERMSFSYSPDLCCVCDAGLKKVQW